MPAAPAAHARRRTRVTKRPREPPRTGRSERLPRRSARPASAATQASAAGSSTRSPRARTRSAFTGSGPAGNPGAVYDAIAGAVPAGSKVVSTARLERDGQIITRYVSFQFRSPAGVQYATLAVAVAAAPGEGAAIRADPSAQWLFARPAWEKVPASARELVTTLPGANAAAPAAQTTVRQPATIRRLAALINRLPVFPPARSRAWPSSARA